jgi:hypothetical protein
VAGGWVEDCDYGNSKLAFKASTGAVGCLAPRISAIIIVEKQFQSDVPSEERNRGTDEAFIKWRASFRHANEKVRLL